MSADDEGAPKGPTITKDTEKATEPLNLVKDECGCSSVGVVAGAIGDMTKCAETSAKLYADATAADIVYGYLKGASDIACETWNVHLDSVTTVGNAVIVEVIKDPTEVGVDTAKAGTGFGLTRIICAAVGAGAL